MMNARKPRKYQKNYYSDDDLFQEYGIHYRIQDIIEEDIREDTVAMDSLNGCDCKGMRKKIKKTEEIARREERQKYVFEGLRYKGIKDTNVETVLDIALKKIDRQDEAKQSIETKAGIILAFWGIVIGAMFQTGIVIDFVDTVFDNEIIWPLAIVGIFWSLSLLAIVVSSVLVFSSKEYQTFILDGEVFRAAVDDKAISMTAILETAVHAANRNKEVNDKKMLILKCLMWSIGMFVFLTFVIQIMTAFYSQS